jgi:aerobic C4-dicarboxylate transport protein
MSEARAVTNFTGNAVATLLIGSWTKELDKDRLTGVLAGRLPFDEVEFGRRDDDSAASANETPSAVETSATVETSAAGAGR